MQPIVQKLSDEQLWIRVKNGDRESFKALYDRLFSMLYSYGRRISSGGVVVEDAVHDVFLDVWNYRETIQATTSVRFYLFSAVRRRVAKNGAKDSRSSIFEISLDDYILEKSTEDVMIESEAYDERARLLNRHLANLPPRQYEALILRFYHDFSYVEIAGLLEVNEQSARNLIQRGLEHLRSYYNIVLSLIIALITPDLF